MVLKRLFNLAVFGTGLACAQPDSLAVREFNDKIAVQVFTLNTSNNFVLNYADENLEVELVPNQKTTLNIGFQYDILSFSLGFAPRIFAENRDNEDSKMIAFGTAIYPGRLMQKFDLYYQKGMTVKDAALQEGLYLPNLKSIKLGGSTSFVFNRDFSFRAITLQNAKQLRSEGSFAPGLSYYYTTLDGRKEALLGDSAYFVDVALEPAYYFNWVIARNFLIAAGASLGAGVNWTVDENTHTAALYKGSLMFAPGYNGERWFGGGHLHVQYAGHDSDANTAVGDVIGYAAAFVGYRFDAPSFAVREKDKIKKRIAQ